MTTDEQILSLLVSGLSVGAVSAIAVAKLGVGETQVEGAISRARRRLTMAAIVNGDEEFGKAKAQLEDCYSKAIAVQDIKTAHSVRKELNKLLGLYARPIAADTEGELGSQLAKVRGHLLPLKLASEDYPVEEHARLAADAIRRTKE